MIRKINKLTPESFLKKVFTRRREIQTSQAAIAKLNQQWIDENCPVKVGNVVKIDKTADGHDSFLVAKIHVDVDQVKGEAGKVNPDKDVFRIDFSYTGQFQGEGVEPKAGRAQFNMKKAEANEAETI